MLWGFGDGENRKGMTILRNVDTIALTGEINSPGFL